MNTRTLLFSGAVIVAATVAESLEVCDSMEDDSSCPSVRIVGGVEVCPKHKYNHLVALGAEYAGIFQQFCGATLYNDEYVITAAHCVTGNNNGLAVSVHRHDLTAKLVDEDGEIILVESVFIHPEYDGDSMMNDVAVLKLKTKAESVGGAGLQDVVLDDGSYQTEGQQLIVAGWGTLSSGGGAPDVPHEVEVPYLTHEQCTGGDSQYSVHEIDEATMLCAGNADTGGQDSCQGDSGGPLFVHCGDDSVVLVGVVSWGYGCAHAGYPGVYAKVSSLADFILDVVNGTYTDSGDQYGSDNSGDEQDYYGGTDKEDCSGQSLAGYESWIGDGFCDDGFWGLYLNCDTFECDGGDCTGCSEDSSTTQTDSSSSTEDTTTESTSSSSADSTTSSSDDEDAVTPGMTANGCVDCDGNACNRFLPWIDDAFCDDGTFGIFKINFYCEEFDFDGGDCEVSMGRKRRYLNRQ